MAYKRRSRKTKSIDAPTDLISELPGNIIDGIMGRLPLHDAARMCVLSHKWNDIWTSTPQLVFDSDFCRRLHKSRIHLSRNFDNIVSEVFLQHDGPIVKCSLYVPYRYFSSDVTKWVSFLSKNGIRDFSLANDFNSPLKLSSRLFSCEGLEKLNLDNCEISLPPKFRGFRKLVSIELHKTTFRECTFEDLIASCPLLEKVSFTKWKGSEHVYVNAPNLKHLIIHGTFRSLGLKSAENLVSASIVLEKFVKISHKTGLRDLFNVLASSSKIEKLSFGGHFCKVLFKESVIPRRFFGKLRSLELLSIELDDLGDFSFAIRTIQSCPNIENLNISVITSKDLNAQVLDYNPDLPLHHLRCAKVCISSAFSTELKLIEFLLACSPVLEVLSLASDRRIKESFRSRMLTQLCQFRRASPKLRLILNNFISVDYPNTTRVSASSFSSESDSDSLYSTSSSSTYTSDSD